MDRQRILQELKFKAVRSSGAGGQHVNKVSSKVELSFDVLGSTALSADEKERIRKNLKSRLTNEGVLTLYGDTTRSQHRNKELVIDRFLKVLDEALKIRKKRKKTRPSKSSVEKRLKSKKKASIKKANRGKPDFD
jgi:ribosome-associated protein